MICTIEQEKCNQNEPSPIFFPLLWNKLLGLIFDGLKLDKQVADGSDKFQIGKALESAHKKSKVD